MKKISFLIVYFILQNLAFSQVENKCKESYTQADLEEMRDRAITGLKKGEYENSLKEINKCFEKSPPACFKDVLIQAKRNKFGSALQTSSFESLHSADGSIPRNSSQSERVEGHTVNSAKVLPPEFLVKDENGAVTQNIKMPDNIIDLAKQKGWLALSYKTRSTGGFDRPPNLLMVVIPGEDKDIYIQTSPHPDTNEFQTTDDPVPKPRNGNLSKAQRTMTVITVDKKTNPPVGQLRLLSSSLEEGKYRWNNSLQVTGCLQCHSTPLRSISPIGYKHTNGSEKSMSDEDQAMVTKINDRMLIENISWGHIKKEGVEIPLGHNPEYKPMGWVSPDSPTRNDDFIKKCSTSRKNVSYQAFGAYRFTAQMVENPSIDYNKIKSAMSCTQCHDGSIRGPINSRFSMSEVKFKILVDQSMPPNFELNMDERIALFNCISAEREDFSESQKWSERAEWLKTESCKTQTLRRNVIDFTKKNEDSNAQKNTR